MGSNPRGGERTIGVVDSHMSGRLIAREKEVHFNIIMPRRKNLNLVNERRDEEVWPYIEQLMNDRSCSESQAHNTQSNESNSIPTAGEQNNELGSLETRRVRGPTLLKDVWNMPTGETIIVKFNNRNQAIGKEGRKLASFLGIVARTPKLVPLNIDDWRTFDKDEKKKLVEFVRKKFSIPTCGEEFVKKSLGKKWKDYKCELRRTYMMKYKTKASLLKNRPNHIPQDQWTGLVSYWVSDKGKKRCQANRSNRTKLKMHHTGGSKSIGTLMDEMTIDGIEPTRAEVFIVTHQTRKDGRPVDVESAKVLDMMIEKLNDDDTSNEQVVGSVAWEGDVYSQVLGSDRSGHVRGLGLGPTPSLLWGTKSANRNENISNEVVKKLEQEVKELKERHSEEMISMIENQSKMLSELSSIKEFMSNFFTVAASMPQNVNGSSSRQVPNPNSGLERAQEATQMSFQSHGIGRIFTASHGASSKDNLNTKGASSKDGWGNSRKRSAILDGKVSAKRKNLIK